jgi:predicted ArsR family transcriptional regulator
MRRIDLKKVSVARSDTIRNINRQIVLNYVRERAPISRAEIAQETALQRSTISIIVDELKAQGLIEEFEGESTGGRPPTLLQLRAADAIAIGVDLSTKNTIVAASDLAGRVLDQEEFPTDPSSHVTLERIIESIRKLIKKGIGIEGVGISILVLSIRRRGLRCSSRVSSGEIGPLLKR